MRGGSCQLVRGSPPGLDISTGINVSLTDRVLQEREARARMKREKEEVSNARCHCYLGKKCLIIFISARSEREEGGK